MRKNILLEEEIIYDLGSAILCALTFILHVFYIPFIMFLKIKKKKKRSMVTTSFFRKRQGQYYLLFTLAQAMCIWNSVHNLQFTAPWSFYFRISANFHKLSTIFETSTQFKKEHDQCL